MSFEATINVELISKLSAIPMMLRAGPYGRCMEAYGKAIVPRAESLAISSRETGSRKKWSKRFRNDPKFASIDSRDHMGSKAAKSGLAVFVGAKYPKGNKQQFIMPVKKGDSYTRYHWGKPGSPIIRNSKRGKQYVAINNSKPTTATFPKSERSVVKAYDQMHSAAENAFVDQLAKEIKELKLG